MIHSSRIAALFLLASPALALAQGLEPALEAVTTQNVKADIFFIASDEMQGRDTPSEEIRIAARYLRSRLMRLGFEEGGTNGYFHEYPLDSSAIDLAGTSASLEGGPSLSFGTDYWFRSRSVRADSECTGGIIYAGSSDADRDLDGLEGIAGSWLAFSDDGRSTGRLRRDAEREEAAGLILIEPEAGEYAVRFEGSKEKLVRGSVSYPSERRRGEAEDGSACRGSGHRPWQPAWLQAGSEGHRSLEVREASLGSRCALSQSRWPESQWPYAHAEWQPCAGTV